MPGTPFATPPAELEKLAGYGRDIAASRAEARRLLREAGVPDGFSFTFKNRGIPEPYEPVGDLAHRPVAADRAQREAGGRRGVGHGSRSSDAATSRSRIDAQCGYVVEPDLDLYKFQSVGISDTNYGRYKDPVLDELFVKQAAPSTPRSASATSAPSRSASSTRRRTTSTRSSGTASSRTARRCAAGRSRRATT